MINKSSLNPILIFLLAISNVAHADFQFTHNSHTYEVITTGTRWLDASAAARQKMVNEIERIANDNIALCEAFIDGSQPDQ